MTWRCESFGLGDHWLGHRSPTDEEMAELRSAAFRFSEEKHSSDPLVSKASEMADAVLELMSPLRTADSVAKLKDASNAYEQVRLRR